MAKKEEKLMTVEEKLRALYELQTVDSKIDELRILAGELPQEVKDMSDEVEGLKTRLTNIENSIKECETGISDHRVRIENANALISRYKEQQNNVRNNREYESLAKEIEFQELEKQLCEKRIREAKANIENYKGEIEKYTEIFDEKIKDLEVKKSELDEIIKETEEREKVLVAKAEENEKLIEERYLTAFKRIRSNARNGLAVVTVDRDACGGCFNKIPHQRQMEIKMHKKVIVCEHCGRILVDQDIVDKALAK